jgi:hypothetical protein
MSAVIASKWTRRRALEVGLGVLAAAMVPRGPAMAQDSGGDPEAVALLQSAAETMKSVQSFRFRLVTLEGVTTILEGIELVSIEGAVLRPDRFRATINATVAVVPVSLDVVGIGDTLWVQDPLSAEGGYRQFPVESGLADVLNPDRLFLEAIGLVEGPTIAGDDEVDGVKATVVEGEFRPLRALELVGTPVSTPSAEDQAEAGLVLNEPLFVQIWIDESNRVIQMAFQGRLLAAEEPKIIRVLRLTDFDQPIEIVPPA